MTFGLADAALDAFGGVLDAAIATGCESLIDGHPEWSPWEVAHGLEDLLALSAGGDCSYDRPSIGTSYALWYHGSRTVEALAALEPWLTEARSWLSIVDLGCGSGATACAAAIAVAHRSAAGLPCPERVHIAGVDASPFMLEAARLVVGQVIASLPDAIASRLSATFTLSSWTDFLPTGQESPVVVAGYLFDHSDEGHVAELAARFARVGEALDAEAAVLLTAAGKRATAAGAVRSLSQMGWAERAVSPATATHSGGLAACHAVRARWYAGVGSVRQALWSRAPSWVSPAPPVSIVLDRTASAGTTLFDVTGFSLLLDDQQENAAVPDEHPTVVAGAAGSGKSRVLAERVVRTLEIARPSAPSHVLVTAFNKSMIDQLGQWIEERAAHSTLLQAVTVIRRDEGWWQVSGRVSGLPVSVTLLNRDRLPNRVLGQAWPGMAAPWASVVATRRHLVEAKHGTARATEVERYLEPTFLDEELERVIYGAGCLTLEAYRTVRRRGRRKPLRADIRDVVWTALMDEPRPDSFVHRRISAYLAHQPSIEAENQLPLSGQWTHVFVDECQDFTEADFKLLACIPPDPNRLFVTGDESQSMHLGPCYRRPGLKRRQWKRIELGGSYRLPVRVCEALEDVAAAFREAHAAAATDELDLVLPEARKSAVIGPRPVVVAGNEATLARDLGEVLKTYRALFDSAPEGPRVSVADGEFRVSLAVAEAAPWVERESASMLKIKGLERACVVFSDCATLGCDEAVPEWVYTAMTRSRSVLILVLWPDATPAIQAVVGRLRSDRLLFWNTEARAAFEATRVHIGSPDDPLASGSAGD